MMYELDILEQVVQGRLAPWLFPENEKEQAAWFEHLYHAPESCTRQAYASFSKDAAQNWAVEKLSIKMLDRHQPPAFLQSGHQLEPVEPEVGEKLLSLVLEQLQINEKQVVEWYPWQDEAGQLHLELYADVALAELSFEEKRFFFYQCLLSEQLSLIRLNTQHKAEALSSEQQLKYIQGLQKTLSQFASQLLEHLKQDQLQVYNFSQDYDLADVFRLIYLHIEELLTFLEQHYTELLDESVTLPYAQRLLAAKELKEPLARLRLLLDNAEVASELKQPLAEALEPLQRLPQQELNYRQLSYYRRFVPQIEKLLQQACCSEDQLIESLVQINFNHPSFIQYCIAHMQKKLEQQDTVAEKRSLLYHLSKSFKQLKIKSDSAFQAGHESAKAQLLSWLEEEITYQEKQQLIENLVEDNPAAYQQAEEKMKTTLSVPQIALLLRLLREVEILPEQNQNQMFRAASKMMSSTRQDQISTASLRSKYYQQDRYTIEVLKEKVIEMLNVLNKMAKEQRQR